MASDVKKWPFWGFKSNLSAFRSNFLPFYPPLKSRNVDKYKKWAPDIKKKMGLKNWIIETQNRPFEVKIYSQRPKIDSERHKIDSQRPNNDS